MSLEVHFFVGGDVKIAAGFGRAFIAQECNLAALDGHHFRGLALSGLKPLSLLKSNFS